MKTAVEVANDLAIDAITYDALQIVPHAQRIDRHARELNQRFCFRLRMEAGLDAAEAALILALNSVRTTRAAYLKCKEAA